jgi:hypothetical protein
VQAKGPRHPEIEVLFRSMRSRLAPEKRSILRIGAPDEHSTRVPNWSSHEGYLFGAGTPKLKPKVVVNCHS